MAHYSLLDGLSKPEQITKRLDDIGIDTCAITDHGSASGAITCLSQFQKAKKKIIIGCELYVSNLNAKIKDDTNRSLSHLLVFAKNLAGWKQLIKLTSDANNSEHFYYKPRLSLEQLKQYSSPNLMWISGHLGSTIASCLMDSDGNLTQHKLQFENKYKNAVKQAEWMRDTFGESNFYLEAQLISKAAVSPMESLTEAIRKIGKKTGIPVVATPDAHYANREDAVDQRILLCRNLGSKTLDDARKADVLSCFFNSDSFHIPSYDEMIGAGHTEEELENTNEFASKIESYDGILQPPQLPSFPCPEGYDADEWLRQLCREGWAKKVNGVVDTSEHPTYVERVKYELEVLQGNGMSSYFLILKDILDYIRDQGWLVGPGRGCLAPDTSIQLSDGTVKDIQFMKAGDKVITKDGKANLVKAVMEYPINNEPLLNIKCYYGDGEGVTLTQDHKILSAITPILSTHPAKKKYGEPGPLGWNQSKDLKVGDWVFVPQVQTSTKHQEKVLDLSVVSNGKSMTHTDKYCQHNVINGLTKRVNRIIEYNRYIPIDKDFFRMLGVFTGDGWLITNRPHRIGFAFNSQTQQDDIEWIVNYFNQLNIETTKLQSKTKHLMQIEVSCKHLATILKTVLFNDYELTSSTKHVPDIVKQTSTSNIQAFLDGYLSADGHISDCYKKYTTISKRLVHEVRYLHRLINKPASLIYNHRKPDKRGYNNSPIVYDIKTPLNNRVVYHYKDVDGGILLRIRSIEKCDDVDTVYDLEVEHEHNYLTSSFIVHNSVGGCLTAYLTDITAVDPIPYGLIFERFYDSSRKTEPPDIDIDVPATKRDKILEYIKTKYGKDYVSQMITYQTMQGRGALKDVFRAHGMSFDEMNSITRHIPDKARIADELQQMKEDRGDSSIIRWTLENDDSGNLKQWCYVEEGELKGPYAKLFEQAIRLEGTKTSQSKHAAGVVIAPVPMSELCPMILDQKTKQPIAGLELNDLEAVGGLKLDLLGLSLLDKMMGVSDILETGDVQ